jgi:hypothetical protein
MLYPVDDFRKLTRREVLRAAILLNERPIKILDFRTPYDVFSELSQDLPRAYWNMTIIKIYLMTDLMPFMTGKIHCIENNEPPRRSGRRAAPTANKIIKYAENLKTRKINSTSFEILSWR